MHKNIAKFEHKVGNRSYTFLCDVDSPLGEAFDAVTLFRNHLINMIEQSKEAAKQSAEATPKPQGE